MIGELQANLEGKTALIGGSTQGIGLATAILMAQAGANVILMSRNHEALENLITELPTPYQQKHHCICADFSHPEDTQKKVLDFIQKNGNIHILVNNSGGPAPGEIIHAQPHQFLHAFEQHLLTNHLLVQAVVEGMKTDKYGRIINIISTSVKQPLPNLGVSNTIRAAVAHWAKTLANELGPLGITVNNVLPGATKTQRLEAIIQNKSQKTGIPVEEIKKEMKSEIPLRRFAFPEEIGYAVLFLASPFAAYINGINLPVDGGRTSSL
ncbi:MAG: short-chain dehydrogenase [Bacteroidia bacterium]|jgi:3-oxoacyl-[acyl-carrier protein] reductase|nr:MAG: short-chain dehydrogenase [Bacteroidia bacterium]